MGLQLTTVGLEAILTNANAEGVIADNVGILHGSKALLFVNQPVVGPRVALGDLTEPTFTGYARVALTWSGPYQDGSYSGFLTGGLVKFVPTAAPGDDVTAYGWGLVPAGATPTDLLALELFPEPILITGTDTPALFVPQLVLPSAQVFGSCTVITG